MNCAIFSTPARERPEPGDCPRNTLPQPPAGGDPRRGATPAAAAGLGRRIPRGLGALRLRLGLSEGSAGLGRRIPRGLGALRLRLDLSEGSAGLARRISRGLGALRLRLGLSEGSAGLGRRIPRGLVVRGLAVVGLLLTLPATQSAHDIPGDVTVQAFVKPEGQRLRLLVRVPLEALSDMAFPTLGPGYLDFERARERDEFTDAAMVWMGQEVRIFENDAPLPEPAITAIKISLPSNRSFETWEGALAHVQGPLLPADTQIVWQQAMLDVLFDYDIQSDQSEFSIRPSFERMGLRVVTVLRFLPPGGAERAFELRGDPGVVRLDPRWHQAAFRFVAMGFEHILDGTDHLLFLACLVIPFRKFKPLAIIVTAFTVAHSVTLIASAYDLAPDALWFPPMVETLIAMSIVYMAIENILGANVQRRWTITFLFGLVHGFGFSFALRETLQFAGSHLLTSLLSFNVGVELGQLLVLAVLVPTLHLLFRHVVAERVGTILLSTLVAHTSWHWMTERWGVLTQFPITWEAFSRAMFTGAMGWMVLLLLMLGALWAAAKAIQSPPPREAAAD